jgi:hypothetical protein
MSLYAHYTTIQQKHGKLEGLISDELLRPLPDLSLIQTLKKQKLLLKEELARMRLHSLERLDAA